MCGKPDSIQFREFFSYVYAIANSEFWSNYRQINKETITIGFHFIIAVVVVSLVLFLKIVVVNCG